MKLFVRHFPEQPPEPNKVHSRHSHSLSLPFLFLSLIFFFFIPTPPKKKNRLKDMKVSKHKPVALSKSCKIGIMY